MKKSYYQKQIFSFSHWTRASYAVFNSLKLQIRIAFLSVVLLVVGFAEAGFAQQVITPNSSEEIDLDTLEVMGELTPELATELARMILLVEPADLESSSIRCLQDAVNSLSPIDLRQRGNNDVQADLSLRGSTFDQVQVLLNGFDITDPQTGHHSLNLPISLNQIDHLEVLTGPGSRVLGPNAYAGAINFVTHKPNDNSLSVSLLGGDFGLADMGIGLSIKNNAVGHYLSVNVARSSGYASNTDFERYSIFYNGVFDKKNKSLAWQMAYSDKSFGANNFYSPKYPNQFEQLRNAFASLSFSTKGKISTHTQAHYRANFDRFELFRGNDEAPSWYQNHNYHFNQVFQMSSKAWMWSKYGKTTVALNLRNESVFSNVLGKFLADTMDAFYDAEGYYTKHDFRTYGTANLEQVYRYKKLKIAAGIMLYYFPSSDEEIGLFPGVDLSYSISKNWNLFTGINTGMRLPTFNDLYYAGPSNIGNPELKSESQTTYEIGAEFSKLGWDITLKTFFAQADNSIDWVRKSDTVKWQPINVVDVQTYGVDVGFRFSPTKLGLKKWQWVNAISLQWSFLDKQTSSPDYRSHYVMDYLKNKVVLTLNHKIYKGLSVSYSLRHCQRNGDYLHYDFALKTETVKNYEPYTLLDVRLNYSIHDWRFYLDLSNVFDVSYQDYGNIIQPSRWLSVGVKKDFKW